MATTEPTDPIARFQEAFARARARETGDVTAMSLATADAFGRPSLRIVLLKGVSEAGLRLLHEPREPQSARARDESRRRALLPLAAPRGASPHRGARRARERRRVRRLFRDEAAREPDWRVGVEAEPAARFARRSRSPRRRDHRALRRRRRPAAAVLGRAIVWCPSASSFGTASRADCTIASSICATARPGASSASIPDSFGQSSSESRAWRRVRGDSSRSGAEGMIEIGGRRRIDAGHRLGRDRRGALVAEGVLLLEETEHRPAGGALERRAQIAGQASTR